MGGRYGSFYEGDDYYSGGSYRGYRGRGRGRASGSGSGGNRGSYYRGGYLNRYSSYRGRGGYGPARDNYYYEEQDYGQREDSRNNDINRDNLGDTEKDDGSSISRSSGSGSGGRHSAGDGGYGSHEGYSSSAPYGHGGDRRYRGVYGSRGRSYGSHEERKQRLEDGYSLAQKKQPSLKSTFNGSKPSFSNPWIEILHITDGQTRNVFELRYEELQKADEKLLEIQQERLRIENSVKLLEKQAEREDLHVNILNEKLEEFAYV
ncbi:uncharacterized protein PRCAT00000851001 [Priceomyces carsonii]|uniref:uncharacterized protein n=1 Tax=Priceomyces carsonii TaxID=28549 RepID=UPI002ED9E12E|nr:unnamed protein product [Priceomyces carsonii]